MCVCVCVFVFVCVCVCVVVVVRTSIARSLEATKNTSRGGSSNSFLPKEIDRIRLIKGGY